MPPRPWPAQPTLVGQLVLLRPFVAADAAAMAEMLTDPDVRRLTGSVHTSEDARSAVVDPGPLQEWYASRSQQVDRLDLAVLERASGAVVGEVVLNEWDPENAACNFRILLGPNGRDRGLGTEATRLVCGHGFGTLGLHRIELEVFAFNPRAQRTYAKVGFLAEGVRRDALRFDHTWIDAVGMAVLAPDWERHGGRPDIG